MVFIHSLKDILSVKVKTRHDGFCDQFNRMFMTKLLLIMSIIMSFDYFADQISCIVDKNSKTNLEKDFIHSACWISGLYIYKVCICNLQTRSLVHCIAFLGARLNRGKKIFLLKNWISILIGWKKMESILNISDCVKYSSEVLRIQIGVRELYLK